MRLPILALLLQLTAPIGLSEAGGDPVAEAYLRHPVSICRGVGPSFALGSGGDLSVAFFGTQEPPQDAFVRISDGRALEWGPKIRLGVAPARTSSVATEGVQVRGSRIYLLWNERGTDGIGTTHFGLSPDAGRHWSVRGLEPEQGARTRTDALQLAVATRPDHDRLFVLQSASIDAGPERLFLARSLDGGTTFGESRPVPSFPGRASGIQSFDLATDGSTVHVVWTEDRDGDGCNEVYHRSSLDGGSNWEASEFEITSTAAVANHEDAQVSFQGNRVVVLWRAVQNGGSAARLLGARSSNDGLDFTVPAPVGSDGPDLFVGDVELDSEGGVFLALWSTEDSGSGALTKSARSLDGGSTWGEEAVLPTTGTMPNGLSLAGTGEDRAVLCRTVEPSVSSAFTTDFGSSWSRGAGPVPIALGVAASTPIAFNPRYRNYTRLYTREVGGAEELVVDGFRPQTLMTQGFHDGSREVSFGFHGFTGEFPFVFVLLSEAPGGFRLPGETARVLGLRPGPLLLATIHGGDGLDAVLDPSGRGETSPRPAFLSLPTLYAVAASYDPNHFTIGALTDVVPLSSGF